MTPSVSVAIRCWTKNPSPASLHRCWALSDPGKQGAPRSCFRVFGEITMRV
jgi:hypothetical protein